MAANARVAMGKRLRFSVFERDGFACQYCGKQPPEVVLHVDHILPVSKGGTNDVDNLRTACQACNSGKHKRVLAPGAVNPMDSLRRLQEAAEDIAIGKQFAKAAKAREELVQFAVNHICKLTGGKECKIRSATSVVNIIREFGAESAISWMDIAAAAVTKYGGVDEVSMMKYLCAIARNQRNAL